MTSENEIHDNPLNFIPKFPYELSEEAAEAFANLQFPKKKDD